MKQLKDLVGKTVILTFRRKSVSQYKQYQVISIASNFLELRGIEGDAGKLSEGTWLQNTAEIDCISDVKPTVEQPTVKLPARAVIPEKKLSGKSENGTGSRNKLLGMSR